MKNSDSFALKSFFEQWLPRLIALSIFAYLIYSLIFRGDTFSGLHIGALAIILALILAPMASRLKVLKVLNFIEFSSKLDDLKREQQETKSQLSELRNQISTVVSTRVSPIQIVTTDGSKVVRELFSSLKETAKEEGKDTKYTREEFLRQAYGYRSRAYVLLLMTMHFQIAMREHRAPEVADFAGDTMDEKIPNMIKRILDNGLDSVFPIRLIDEKSGETRSVITPEIIEGLQLINSLLGLSQKIENDEIELPPRLEINNLFDKIHDALVTIGLGLEVVGTNFILYQYRVANMIKELKKEFGVDNSQSTNKA